MPSVASEGTTERIVARILLRVVRAGSGTRARYASMSFGMLRFDPKPSPPDITFFTEVSGTPLRRRLALLPRTRLDFSTSRQQSRPPHLLHWIFSAPRHL